MLQGFGVDLLGCVVTGRHLEKFKIKGFFRLPVFVGGEQIPGRADIFHPFVGLTVDFLNSLLEGQFRIHLS